MSRIRVLSYNVRYDSRQDRHDAWYARRDGVLDVVRFHRPDVAGFQEPLPGQRADLREGLPQYAFVGHGREAGGEGEGCPIAVRTDRWQIVDDGTFWLSETPAEPSTDWDAAHPRIATWAAVEPHESPAEPVVPGRRPLLVVNTHFDHVSPRARRESARLLVDRIPSLGRREDEDTDSSDGGVGPDGAGPDSDGRRSVVFVGDLNCTVGTEPYRILTGEGVNASDESTNANGSPGPNGDEPVALRDAVADADVRHGPTTSVTDFVRLVDNRRIDHVLVTPDIEAEAVATLTDRDDRGRYPSDHLPVLARLRRHSAASMSSSS